MGGNYSISARAVRKKNKKYAPIHFLTRTHSILHLRESGPMPVSEKWAIKALQLREKHCPTRASVNYTNTFSFDRYL